MKLALLGLLLFPLLLTAQFVVPASSPAATSTTTVGYTELSVSYHRPNVRNRLIFGELIPWGKLWRAGANESTTLTLDGPVTIGETQLEAGSYSLFLIPREEGNWTWVINEKTGNWGTNDYNQTRDAVRHPARARRLPARTESLEYRWTNASPQSVQLVLEWEWYRVALTIGLPTDEQVATRASLNLNPAKNPKEYYAVARYYLDNGRLRQAKAWMDRYAGASEEAFAPLRDQALIEYGLGNAARGKRLMQRSLDLAREAGNEHYARMNEQSLREWTETLVDIPVDSVIARSIRYHDPHNAWGRRSHRLLLAESRPDGSVRSTRLTLYPGSDEFDLQQTRNGDKVQMRYLKGAFSSSLNGSAEVDEATAERLGLTPKGMLRMRDYYTYLYGLPMKLTDAGTQLQPDVRKVWFHGRELLRVDVRYAPEAGSDVWQFYFNPRTYALSGYSFYHEVDGPGTGEYIILEGEIKVGPMVLPAKRHWYLAEENRYLGSDLVVD